MLVIRKPWKPDYPQEFLPQKKLSAKWGLLKLGLSCYYFHVNFTRYGPVQAATNQFFIKT